MAAISNHDNGVVAKLIPGGAHDFSHVSDEQLLANTRRIAGTSNQLLAALLAHLAEVEARGIHRTRRCASLYTYCIYELRFSEDAAARRSAAVRLTKQFPTLLQAIADGELHLTGLLMLGPHLTPDNHAEVLARAKFRTKKELTKLLRELHPLPHVPDRIEPVGPSSPVAPRNPTWEELVTAYAPRVRELPPGERPRDWTCGGSPSVDGDDGNKPVDGSEERCRSDGNDRNVAAAADQAAPDLEPLPLGPMPRDLPPVTPPQQYQVQFSTIEEHAQLIERARALLSRGRAGMTLGELHLEAMRLLVASLEKRRFAVNDGSGRGHRTKRAGNEPPRQRGAKPKVTKGRSCERSRYIPAAERRDVYHRDGGRCTYVDARGERCCETGCLELHHLEPFAKMALIRPRTSRCAAPRTTPSPPNKTSVVSS